MPSKDKFLFANNEIAGVNDLGNDVNAVLELNSSLVFPILEMLLGGNGKASPSIQREITEIEQSLLEGFFRIILRDLKEAWRSVTTIDFTIESLDIIPQSYDQGRIIIGV